MSHQGYGLVSPALSLGIGKTFCIPPPSVIPTGASITDLLRATNAHSLVSVPSIIEEMSNLPQDQGIHVLASLQFVTFGGGLLKSSVGKKLTAGSVRILNHYGSTESGPIAPFFVPEPDHDWRYFRLRKDVYLRLEPGPILEDGIQSYTLITHPFGWTTPFIFQDQLISNPQKPGSDFSAIGRNDDLIVLANGEKVNPRILETMLSECQLVNTAIAFGDGQFEVGVLVQPSSTLAMENFDDFKSAIWPTILQAGERMDAHARISSKEVIVIVSAEASLPRSDKGSLMRKEVYKMFEEEISAVYQALENSVIGPDALSLDMDDLDHDLKRMIQTRLAWRVEPQAWTIHDDFFELGMDSLQAVQLRRFILSSLPDPSTMSNKAERLPLDIVYQNPTVAQLAKALKASAGLPSDNNTTDSFVRQFSGVSDLPSPNPRAGAVILMTGGTGSLGSCVLAHLTSLPSVSRVICLNRPHRMSDCNTRQLQALDSRGISVSLEAWAKVEVFETDTALPLLGLNQADYSRTRDQLTHIVHMAWPMDFKRKISSFKSQFQILHNLLSLARSAHIARPLIRPRILFVSSIAVVGRYPITEREIIVPELSVEDERYTNDIGYAKAKLVCEKMLEKAAQDYPAQLEAAYVRIGQMSGSAKSGSWNVGEHIAALFKSSQAMGSLPKLRGVRSPRGRSKSTRMC